MSGNTLALGGDLPLDARIAVVSDAQHGVIGLGQLQRCGLGPSGTRRRAATGRLHRLHRGVYTPGHTRLPSLGRTVAAVLACGRGAVVSHLTAAWVHGLRQDARVLSDVTVCRRTGRRHDRVITHSAAGLRPQDVVVVDGVPVTSIARTLLDCAPILAGRGTEKLCQTADRQGSLDLRAVRGLLAHVSHHRGVRILSEVVADVAGTRGMTEPGDEDRLLVAFRAAGLPEPECNVPLPRPDGSWAYPDFLWRAAGLVVEADSLTYHNQTRAYREDRRRDRALRRVGFETMRFSDEDMRDPATCAAEVAARLVETGAGPAQSQQTLR